MSFAKSVMSLSDALVWCPQNGGYVENWLWSQSSETRSYVKEVIMEVGQWVRKFVGKKEGEEHSRGRRLHRRIEWIYDWGIGPTLRENEEQEKGESYWPEIGLSAVL